MAVAFIVCDQYGKILRVGSCQDELVSAQAVDDTEISFVGTVPAQEEYYVSLPDKAVKALPAKPSPHHEWDWATKSWLPNLDAARNAKLQQVAAELNTRLYLPCNGFDADKTSRERISGMIARLQRGDGLPAGWVGWRDAQNQMHWQEETAAVVLHNLTSLARCIEDREQALLVASWQHKANIAALTNIDAITGYDVTAGWPT